MIEWARYALLGLGLAGATWAFFARDVLGVLRWFL